MFENRYAKIVKSSSTVIGVFRGVNILYGMVLTIHMPRKHVHILVDKEEN